VSYYEEFCEIFSILAGESAVNHFVDVNKTVDLGNNTPSYLNDT